MPARRSAYSLLLKKGLIRISLPVPATADFQITEIDGSLPLSTDHGDPARNVPAAPAGNESPLPDDGDVDGRVPKGQSLTADLTQQAIDSTRPRAMPRALRPDRQSNSSRSSLSRPQCSQAQSVRLLPRAT